MFSIREHTTVCERLRKNFGEKTNSFRGNIFIDRKKKRKRKNYAIEKKIFSLEWRACSISRGISQSFYSLFSLISKQTNKLDDYKDLQFERFPLAFVVVCCAREKSSYLHEYANKFVFTQLHVSFTFHAWQIFVRFTNVPFFLNFTKKKILNSWNLFLRFFFKNLKGSRVYFHLTFLWNLIPLR